MLDKLVNLFFFFFSVFLFLCVCVCVCVGGGGGGNLKKISVKAVSDNLERH